MKTRARNTTANVNSLLRHVDPQEGTFEEVIRELKEVMDERLRQERFRFEAQMKDARPFTYDHEGMIQVLIDLVENS